MVRVLRTPQADADLADIWSYIAADNLSAANELIRKIDEMMRLLSGSPHLGIAQFHYREICGANSWLSGTSFSTSHSKMAFVSFAYYTGHAIGRSWFKTPTG